MPTLQPEIAETAAEIGRFFDLLKRWPRWPPSSWIFKWLIFNCVELRHHAKFRGDRSNRCINITNFGFFKMTAIVILDFQNFKFLTVETVKRIELWHADQFRQYISNGCYSTLHAGRHWVIAYTKLYTCLLHVSNDKKTVTRPYPLERFCIIWHAQITRCK